MGEVIPFGKAATREYNVPSSSRNVSNVPPTLLGAWETIRAASVQMVGDALFGHRDDAHQEAEDIATWTRMDDAIQTLLGQAAYVGDSWMAFQAMSVPSTEVTQKETAYTQQRTLMTEEKAWQTLAMASWYCGQMPPVETSQADYEVYAVRAENLKNLCTLFGTMQNAGAVVLRTFSDMNERYKPAVPTPPTDSYEAFQP